MKPARAFLACSMLSTLYFVACGSDDGKNVNRATDGGAGGEAGEPSIPASGAAGEPPTSSGGEPAEGGAAGAAGAGASSGEGGAGGEAPVCSGFDQPIEGEGGAAGAGQLVPLQFRCEAFENVSGAFYNTQTRKIILPALPGLEPTSSGNFTFFYSHELGTDCGGGTVRRVDDGIELSAPVLETNQAVADSLYNLEIAALTLRDECDGTAVMDTSSINPDIDSCWHIQFSKPEVDEGTWAISCYEGFGESCITTCPL